MSRDTALAANSCGSLGTPQYLRYYSRSHCGPNWQTGEVPQLRMGFPRKNSQNRGYSLRIRCPTQNCMRGQGQGLCKIGERFAGGFYAKDGHFPKCRRSRPG